MGNIYNHSYLDRINNWYYMGASDILTKNEIFEIIYEDIIKRCEKRKEFISPQGNKKWK